MDRVICIGYQSILSAKTLLNKESKMFYKLSKSIFISLFLILATISITGQENQIVFGERVNIKSELLNQERELLVRLPENYEGSTNRYPVMYLLDGSTHFYYVSAFVKSIAAQKYMPEMIIVAVKNINRTHDLTPSAAVHPYYGPDPVGGGADKFIQFFSEELVPYIENKYRAGNYRIIAGHSQAGQFVTYTLFNYPDLFDAYLACSPALQWDDKRIIKSAGSVLDKGFEDRKDYFISVGANELEEYLDFIPEFVSILKQKVPKNLFFTDYEIPKAHHGNASFTFFHYALTDLFDGWRYDIEKQGKKLETITQHYDSLSNRFGLEVEVPEGLLYHLATRALDENKIDEGVGYIRYMKMEEEYINGMGYEKVEQNNLEAAIALFNLNVELYPNSANVYDSLGEVYLKSGKNDLALINYKKAVELNPNNKAAVEIIVKLK